jgi:hypothetical protein
MKFYINWEIIDRPLVVEEMDFDSFEEASAHTRERYASGLVELTEALGPFLADQVADLAGVSEMDHARMHYKLGSAMREIVRIFIPTHQILRVAVASVPIRQDTDLADFHPPGLSS